MTTKFKDMRLLGGGQAIAEMMAAAEGRALGGWQRVTEKEKLAIRVGGAVPYAFEHRGGVLRDAGLLITARGPEAEVSNIVPIEPGSGSITPGDYNALLLDFASQIEPIAAAHGVTIAIGRGK